MCLRDRSGKIEGEDDEDEEDGSAYRWVKKNLADIFGEDEGQWRKYMAKAMAG